MGYIAKLTSVQKGVHFFKFSLEKSSSAIDGIRDFFVSIGFDVGDANMIYTPMGDIDNNYARREYRSKLYTDRCFTLAHPKFTVDVFFGFRLVFVSIKTNVNCQDFLSQKMNERFRF